METEAKRDFIKQNVNNPYMKVKKDKPKLKDLDPFDQEEQDRELRLSIR